jgi:uncharacterized protein (TIGR02186 family)
VTGARALAVAAALAAATAAAPAKAERLVSSLSTHQVLISSNFTGTEIVLFGSVERDAATVPRRGGYDLVVTVKGPRETMVVRQKKRVFGIWANAASRTFIGVPSYLAVLSNRPLDAIAPPDLLRRLEIGLSNVPLPEKPTDKNSAATRDLEFRGALIRLRTNQTLYREQANAVTFLTPNLFRASITVPAIAPLGTYEVDLKLFADGTNVARTTSALELVKVGAEQFIANAAREHGLIYGLATTLMALATGWFASILFRRD